MRLLILSNYFTPDLSAGSFRMQAFVEALAPYALQGLEVDLITTLPNRYASLRAEAPSFEDRGWLRIHRIALPAHQGGMADQARVYLRYAMAVRRLTKGKRWDLVFATSSRLMTAALGANLARRIGAPLYLDIRDLFTLNMDELLANSPLRLLLPVFRLLERRSLRAASRINVVSEGFLPQIHAVAPGVPVSCFTNGIDDLFLVEDYKRAHARAGLPLVLYAGNMGEGQGLHRIVPAVAKAMAGRVQFRLIGDGGKRRELEQALARADVSNVELLPPVSRTDLIAHYREADILFLHLNDLEAFRKVLPSKLFEYAATGKPIAAGVAGHAADFIAANISDASVFAPCDAQGMVQAIEKCVSAGERAPLSRTDFIARFSRRNLMRELAAEVLQLAGSDKARDGLLSVSSTRG
ncbi:MAG: glycosyltransferase family 4 protein [Tabrizicola sp.]